MKELEAFKYGEFEGVFNPMDYEQAEALEKVTEIYQERIAESENYEKESEKLRLIGTTITDDIFDGIFGDGTSNLMFGEQISSVNILLDALYQLLDYINQQGEIAGSDISNITKRFQGNRTTRRTTNKSVKKA